jgi:large conductance mechanosensitive channel
MFMTPATINKAVIKPTAKFMEEFKIFAIKGNVLDLAIAVVIGAAGGRVVTSLVNDLITPPISMLMGKVNFANLFVTLSSGNYATLEEAKKAGAVTFNYGAFLNTALDFVVVTFVVFLAVRAINRLRRETPPAADQKECGKCLSMVKKAATRCAFCTSELAP